jgi:uncharacterized membrane protein
MTAPHADQLIAGYLARLRVAATDPPSSARDELIEDMRAHITEARAREAEETDATILNILDRLGEPDAVVAEAGSRRDVFGSSQPSGQAEPYRPGILEIAALVLLPFVWIIAVILVSMSPAWKTRDKVVGTIFSLGGYPGILIIGAASGHHVLAVTWNNSTMSALQMVEIIASVALVISVWLLPAITAAYLAVRLRWGRRPRAVATA